MRSVRIGVAIAALTCVGLVAGTAAAAPTEDFKARVSYKDLDINDPAGARVLYQRIKDASAAACESDAYIVNRSLKDLRTAKACYTDLVDSFVARIDSDELQKLHDS